jgi:hypothetical protein
MSTNPLNLTGTTTVSDGSGGTSAGPIGNYAWDEFEDFGEEPGFFNGQKVYKSVATHADGYGNVTYWYIFEDGGEATALPQWAASSFIGDYAPDLGPPEAEGLITAIAIDSLMLNDQYLHNDLYADNDIYARNDHYGDSGRNKQYG